MINLNKKIIFIFFLFIIVITLIAGCETKVMSPIINSQKPTTIQAPSPQPTMIVSETNSSASASAKPTIEITSVKCDGSTYNLAVKANHRLLWIMLNAVEKLKIADLKSQGLIMDYAEIAKNDGTVALTFTDSRRNGPFSSGMAVLIADVKKENSETVWNKIRNDIKGTLGLSYLGERLEGQDTILEYACKVK